MRSYHEFMGKHNKIRNHAFQWVRATASTPTRLPLVGPLLLAAPLVVICPTESVHSLALPRSDSGDDSRGSGTGTGAPEDGSHGGRPCASGAANLSEGGGSCFCAFSRCFCGTVVALMMPI